MGTTNYGSQTLSFDFKNAGKAESFNKLNYKLVPAGIYSGGTLTKVDSDTVQVSALTAYLYDDVNQLGVRVQTSSTVNKDVGPSVPYIILRFSWSNVENNYVDVLAVDYDSLGTNDLIIGRCSYNSLNVLQTTFDYSRKHKASLQDLEDAKNNLKVVATEPISNKVRVLDGKARIYDSIIDFSESNSSALTDTTDGRIDFICIDSTGAISVIEGADAVAPSEPDVPTDEIVLAKVTRGASRDDVRGDDITQYTFDKELGTPEISDFMKTVLDDADAGTVLSTLRLQNSGTSFPVSPETGEVFYRSDVDMYFKYNGATWIQL